MSHVSKILNALCRDEAGATAIEYGLIVAFIALAMIGAARTLGGEIGVTFTTVRDGFDK